jgi:hypothetical protein
LVPELNKETRMLTLLFIGTAKLVPSSG